MYKLTCDSFALFGHEIHVISFITFTFIAAGQIHALLRAGIRISTFVNICQHKSQTQILTKRVELCR